MNKFNIPAANAPSPIPLRDYFAARVLPWVTKDYYRTLRNDGEPLSIGEPNDPSAIAIGIARECYALADAMLAVSRGETCSTRSKSFASTSRRMKASR